MKRTRLRSLQVSKRRSISRPIFGHAHRQGGKEKILKASRDLKQVTWKKLGVRIRLAFSVATLEVQDREPHPCSLGVGGKNEFQLKILYPVKLKQDMVNQSLKLSFPYLHYHGAAGGCVPPHLRE